MRKAKNILILFFLIILPVYFLFTNNLFAAPAGASAQMKEIEKLEASQKQRPPVVVRPRVEYKAEGLKDPFQGVKKKADEKSPQETVKVQLPVLTVQGIVWGSTLPQAIINNRVLKIGDTIEGARVIDVNKDGVTLFYGGQQYNLYSPAAGDLQKGVSLSLPEGGNQDEE